MLRALSAALLLLCLCLSIPSFGQSSYATVSGTISDTSGALLPGVTVTATNNATSVVTTVLSNESGLYNLPSLLPGNYKISASLPGFQTQTRTDVQLGNAQQVRINFTMTVASVATSVEVSVAADTLLSTSSSSVGEVLTERKVEELPIVGALSGKNIIDLIAVMSGVRIGGAVFGADATSFAGIPATDINVQRDGITADAGGKYTTGVQTATRINPDLVGEVRMVLAPVDAEQGRGNGQIQIQSRSGTNAYHGSAVWDIQNTALNANSWANNRVQPNPTKPDWTNQHEYTLSFGGPIKKGQTFFFVLWDGFIGRTRTNQNPLVLTPCARNGIFRYYDGWNNGNATATTTATGTTPVIAVVDAFGNPKAPTTNIGANQDPATNPFTGSLHYVSVFGRLVGNPTQPDCSDAVVQPSTNWDPFRTQQDSTGYVKKLLTSMPLPNNYEAGGSDGLNTAGFRWVRHLQGSDNLFGIGDPLTNRKQINVNIDHNFNQSNKLSGRYSYERSGGDDYYMNWPDTFEGANYRRPQFLSINFTSTLSPVLLNEARFGYRKTGGNNVSPLTNPKTGGDAAAYFLNFAGIPTVPQLGTGTVNFQFNQPFGNRGIWAAVQRDKTPLYQWADTVSWTKGRHAFKFGGEFRLNFSDGFDDGGFGNTNTVIRPIGGETTNSPIATNTISTTNMPGLAGTAMTGNNQRMRSLLDFLAGSLSTVNQLYFMEYATKTDVWEDYRTFSLRERNFHATEYSGFFKDDWKLNKNLTLNLGLRYDYYGVPFITRGLTASPVSTVDKSVTGGRALFGISGTDFTSWMNPNANSGSPMAIQFVGPDSPNPNLSVWPSDRNNFGPAIGFSWQVPWFGEGMTSVRGGYQITYQGTPRFDTLNTAIGNAPGTSFPANYVGTNFATGAVDNYLDLTDLPGIIPIAYSSAQLPMQPLRIDNPSTRPSFTGYDPNYTTPYVQNFTLSVTRSLRHNMTVDVRYIGTMGVKQYSSLNLNTANFLYNGLKEAFDSIRAGGESTLLDNMMKGLNIAGTGCQTAAGVATPCAAIGSPNSAGVPQTAGMHMRASTTFNTNLANGNYAGVAGSLSTLTINTANNPTVPSAVAGAQGAVLRYNGFAENFIVTNPQFSAATFNNNMGHNNYHSVQVQYTMRPTHGLSYQGTFTWSQNLGVPTGNYTNPVDRHPDYTVVGSNRKFEFRNNGTFELPIGPNKLLLANSSGWLARVVERWQMGWIWNMASGAPSSITTNNMLYANGTPDIVGPFPFDSRNIQWGNVTTSTGQLNGSMFDPAKFALVRDPQCTAEAVQLQSLCTLNALQDVGTGQLLLQNPLPGKRGTLGQNIISGIPDFRLDANISKTFKISESKSVQVRIDTNNVLNHPLLSAPSLALNPGGGTAFGTITNKGGIASTPNFRQFQGEIRISF
jgi:hypothetical protein